MDRRMMWRWLTAIVSVGAVVLMMTLSARATVDDSDLPDDKVGPTASQPSESDADIDDADAKTSDDAGDARTVATSQPTSAAVSTQPTTTTSAPASRPSTLTTTQPTSVPAAATASPEVERILDRLEKKRDEIRDFQSEIRYQLYEVIPDAKRTQTGIMRYRAGTEKSRARFMVYFDSLYQDADDIRIKQKEWYCFDGRMFREIREHTKNAIDREVVHEGEKIDPFELGQGPFPMPFGQKKVEMLRNFDVVMKNDPKQADIDHIVLTPKGETRLAKQYKRIEFFLAKNDQIPRQVVSEDRHDNIITVDFKNVVINKGLADDQLWIEPPLDYQKSVVND